MLLSGLSRITHYGGLPVFSYAKGAGSKAWNYQKKNLYLGQTVCEGRQTADHVENEPPAGYVSKRCGHRENSRFVQRCQMNSECESGKGDRG